MKKYIPWIIIGLLILSLLLTGILCYSAGKKSVKCESNTVYIPGETIHDTVTNNITLIHTEKPNIDTINLLTYCIENGLYEYLYEHYYYGELDDSGYSDAEVDTLAIIADFITKNTYETELFDIDTVGKCIVNSTVQYNKLVGQSYTFTPIQKVITKERQVGVEPFIGIGATTRGFMAYGGVYVNKWIGVQAGYLRQSMGEESYNDFMVGFNIKL